MASTHHNSLTIRLWLAFSAFRRTACCHFAMRHKFLVAFVVFFVVVLMQVGTLKQKSGGEFAPMPVQDAVVDDNLNVVGVGGHPPAQPPQSVGAKKLRAKEYPDFDYKYDLKKDPLAPAAPYDSELADIPVRKAPQASKNIFQQKKSLPRELDAAEMKLLLNPAEVSDAPQRDYRAPSVPAKQRRAKMLNGAVLDDNYDQFDVVGGADLFRKEHLNAGYDDFAADEAKVVPGLGEMGEPVKLTGHEEELGKRVMEKEAFNLVASDKISLHRTVPDTRDPKCKDLQYDRDLPTASVVIIFTNEAWTPLLRTIWSVLDKTPEEYLKEIILVDDYSDKKHLKGKLERYIQQKFPSKVKLKRLPKRSGLIRARLTGAELATGDALIFLDSHCECGYDWIEPLLHRIKHEPKAFVVPIIDVIDDKTLEYYHGNGAYFQIGGFTWNGHFNWIDIPSHEDARRGGSNIAPTRTPTMAGGLFAVGRKYFWEIGSYDEEMDVWGGENLEMSFRVWQCGGVLETIPCSRVGHIFRSFHPYTFPGNKDTHGINTARTVEVWMDDYKRLFYMNRPDLMQSTEVGSVSKRMRFKEEKQCKSFQWYLDNIYPQKFILDSPDHVFAHGRARNPAGGVCLDTLQNDEKDAYELGVYPCHNYMAASQFFSLSKAYELRREDSCAEVSGQSAGVEPVRMVSCASASSAAASSQSDDQEWIHTKEGRLIHKATNKCLDAAGGSQLYAGPCKAVKSQIWYFDNYIS